MKTFSFRVHIGFGTFKTYSVKAESKEKALKLVDNAVEKERDKLGYTEKANRRKDVESRPIKDQE